MELKKHVEPAEAITCIPEYDISQMDYPRQEEQALVERLRRGEEQAREMLLSYLQRIFHAYARKCERISRIDYRDLVQEALLNVLEHFEDTLTKREPVSMCLAIGRYTISQYCYEYRGLIKRPAGSKKVAPFRFDSLDQPLWKDDTRKTTLGDLLAAPVSSENDASQQDSTLLYAALEQLGPAIKETVIRHYGLYEQPAETYQEIAGIAEIDGPLDSSPVYKRIKNRMQQGVYHLYDALKGQYLDEDAPASPRRRPSQKMHLSAEQQAKLDRAYAVLQAEGAKVTTKRLQQEAKVGMKYVCIYLRSHAQPQHVSLHA